MLWTSRRVRRSGTSWSLLGRGCWYRVGIGEIYDIWLSQHLLGAWYSLLVLLIIINLQWNIPSFDKLKALTCLSLALEFIEGGKIDRVPLIVLLVQHCASLFCIAQSIKHFDRWIGLQLWTRLTISSRGQTLVYCPALFFLTVNRYTVTVQKRQFLVSRPS